MHGLIGLQCYFPLDSANGEVTGKSILKSVLLITVFCIGTSIGCSNVQVADSHRTRSNTFDGRWIGTISASEKIQYANSGTLSCDAIETTIWAEVTGGVLTAEFNFDKNLSFTANLNDQGRFYAEVPKEASYTLNGRSRFGAHEFHVFRGVLFPRDGVTRGYYRNALGQMGSGGCEYEILFARQEAQS